MPQWEQGYPAGVEYVRLAKSELSPAHINFCLALSGRATVALDAPFTYAELGAGFGQSIAGWAAQYPQGRFHCIDYNPVQTAWTRQAAEAAGLANLTVHTAPVEAMLKADLPPFDFIVLHGLYSWVPEQVRAEIRLFLRRFLADGGCAYVSYNCMPGNKDTEAIRRLLKENVVYLHGMRHHRMVDESLALLRELKACEAAFFADSPKAAALLAAWADLDPDYLVGELMPQEHASFYFSEMHEAMSGAGLVWAGSAGVRHHLEDMAVPDGAAALLARRGQDPVFRETLKDFCFNTTFRQDLFSRRTEGECGREPDAGPLPEKLSSPRHALETMSFCLKAFRDLPACSERPDGQNRPDESGRPGRSGGPAGSVLHRLCLDPEVNRRVQSALVRGPATLGRIGRDAGLGRDSVTEAVTVLIGLGLVWPCPAAERQEVRERVRRLNLFLLNNTPQGERAALLSANGGWIADWEPLLYAYQTARLLGLDAGGAGGGLAARMKRELRELERRADGADWSADGHGGSAGETVDAFLREHGDEMEVFAVRHGWA